MTKEWTALGHSADGTAADRLRGYVSSVGKYSSKRAKLDPALRFFEKVAVRSNGCHEWIGSKSPQGYGWFAVGRPSPALAHRVAYEAAHHPIPAGMVIDHLCRNRACVNPAHLECVTMGENTRRGILHDIQRAKAKQKTHCKRGHPLFGANLRVSSSGHRMCEACQKMMAAAWKKRNQEHVNEMQRIRRAKGNP